MMYTLLITSVMFMTYGFNKDVPEIFENYVHMVSYHSHESIGIPYFNMYYQRVF